jgi:16S rRNA (adenine1518-N6/adenine1519-N6)-dimethyltransferase
VRLIEEIDDKIDFDQIVEIGPGPGVLTKHLYKTYKNKLHLIEYDQRFVGLLKDTYSDISEQIHQADVLRFDFNKIEGKLIIAGNFPYNISSQILFKAIEYKEKVSFIIGMFQKEMAQRVAAKHGNKSYGILSILMQAFYNVTYLFDVPPTVFSPPPKVMSGIIKLEYAPNKFQILDHKVFVMMVKLAFNQRRKTMRNSLKSMINDYKISDEIIFDKRPEQLSVGELVDLANHFVTNKKSNEA